MRNFKEEKVFKKADIIVYVAIIALLAIIFSAVLIPKRRKTELTGADIYYGDEKLFSYSFADGKGEITDFGAEYVSVEYGEKITVRIATEKGKNTVEIGEGYIKMTEADCSGHPDCVEKFLPLTAGGGVIVCLPHDIRIVSEGGMPQEVKI